jgi:hypothetical protein
MAKQKFKSKPQQTPSSEQISDSGQSLPEKQPATARSLRLWVGVALVVFLAIYILRVDHVVGLAVDDGWYVLLGKAIASGQGYRIINSPGTPIMPLYPPGFPFLLSFVFRIAPKFPENFWLLKSISIIAMLGVGVLTFQYCRRYRAMSERLSLVAGFTVAIAPPFAYLATSTVMSECVFALAQIATIILAESCATARGRAWAWRGALLWRVIPDQFSLSGQRTERIGGRAAFPAHQSADIDWIYCFTAEKDRRGGIAAAAVARRDFALAMAARAAGPAAVAVSIDLFAQRLAVSLEANAAIGGNCRRTTNAEGPAGGRFHFDGGESVWKPHLPVKKTEHE